MLDKPDSNIQFYRRSSFKKGWLEIKKASKKFRSFGSICSENLSTTLVSVLFGNL